MSGPAGTPPQTSKFGLREVWDTPYIKHISFEKSWGSFHLKTTLKQHVRVKLRFNKGSSPWSIEFLPSNPAVRFRFLAGQKILISILELGVFPLSVYCPLLSLSVALTLCWPHIPGGPTLCIYLVLWSIICCSPLQASDPRVFGFKSRGVSPTFIIIIAIIIIIIISVVPKGRFFSEHAGSKVAVLHKSGLPPQTQKPRLQYY